MLLDTFELFKSMNQEWYIMRLPNVVQIVHNLFQYIFGLAIMWIVLWRFMYPEKNSMIMLLILIITGYSKSYLICFFASPCTSSVNHPMASVERGVVRLQCPGGGPASGPPTSHCSLTMSPVLLIPSGGCLMKCTVMRESLCGSSYDIKC